MQPRGVHASSRFSRALAGKLVILQMTLAMATASAAVAAAQGTQDMIKIEPSSRNSGAPWPRPNVPEYTFSVRSYGGRSLGVDIHEFDWTLQVDSRRGLVAVESFRSDADIPGQPIGLFRFAMPDGELRDWYRLIEESKLMDLKPAMQKHPGYTQRQYTVMQPARDPVQVVINNSDEQTNARLAPLRNKINSTLSASFKHPERAVQLGLKHARSGEADAFEVTITNIGTETVSFTDPRWIVPAGPLQQAGIMISEFPETPPGEPPALSWNGIPLQALKSRPAKEALVTLQPGAVWQASSVGWKRTPGKRYLAYFTWANYAGSPLVAEIYRIRGRADSPRLVIEP
jgi:hypothetical protein